jgi:hypothetical protein
MLLPTHALTGMVIGKYVSNPWIIIPASLLLHYLIDSFRHGEYWEKNNTAKNFWWKIDALATIVIIVLIFLLKDFGSENIRNMLLGAFFSLLPDLLSALQYLFPKIKVLNWQKKIHAWTHNYSHFPQHSAERQWTLRNSLNDLLISLVAIAFLFL